MRLLLICSLFVAVGCCTNPYAQFPPSNSSQNPYGNYPVPPNYRAPRYPGPANLNAPPSAYSQSSSRAPSPYPPPPSSSANRPTLPPARDYPSRRYRDVDDEYGWRPDDRLSRPPADYPPSNWDPYSSADPYRRGAVDSRSYAEPFRAPSWEPLRGRGFRDTRWPF